MGYYINPADCTKEAWLNLHGKLSAPDAEKLEGHHLVCLVTNPGFTAAGIAFDERERQAFAREDGRPKKWYQVPDDKLIEVCPHVKGALA